MTTSSFERNRCTRISPSAVLDDRLDGKDLEWARDHLRRCEACRERVEDFREMLLRVGRLPSAVVGPAAMDEAFALSIPDRLRAEAVSRSYEVAPAPPIPAPTDLPSLARPEISSIPDLLTELEREIFRDEPVQDHPTRLSPMSEPLYPTMAEAQELESEKPAEPVPTHSFYEPAADEPAPLEPEPTEAAIEPEVSAPQPAEAWPASLREVPVDSHREVDNNDWAAQADPHRWEPQPEPVHAEPSRWDAIVAETAERPVEEQHIHPFDQASEVAAPVSAGKPDNAMRIAVGLGAAACVLLAAVLYEGGLISKVLNRSTNTAKVVATASLRPSTTVRASISPSLSPTVAPSVAPVLFTLGNGVGGGTMFRIRPGTAVAAYTRLVFDMHGTGLPTMVISQPDALHLVVTFKGTNVTSAPVNGISTRRVAAVEPGVQQGPDGVMTIDLARQVQVKASTLNATGGYAWRLVMDLYDG
jgi:hypothetical protein